MGSLMCHSNTTWWMSRRRQLPQDMVRHYLTDNILTDRWRYYLVSEFYTKIKALVSGREHSATGAEVVKAKAATLNQRPTPSPLSLSKSILSFWTSGVCREEMNCRSQHSLTHTSRLIAYWYRISKVLWKWFSVWGPCVSGRDCFAET